MRIFLLLLLFFAPLFAYKNAFYIGAYLSMHDGKFERGGNDIFNLGEEKVDHELSDNSLGQGFRFGWHNNSSHTNLAKTRYEFFYEKRDIKYKVDNNEEIKSGYHLGFSMSFGYNLDLMTTHEIVPYIKLGIGAGNFKGIGNGSETILGVGVAYVTRYFEIIAGADREFWQLSGLKIPLDTPVDNDGYLHNYHLGLNFRF